MIYKISIRNLIEFVLRSGDIDSEGTVSVSNERALLGANLHRKIQRDWAKRDFKIEQSLSITVNLDNYDLLIEGRADGIDTQSNIITIYEIKTVGIDLGKIDEKYDPLHWAQAYCYAYIYLKQNNIEEANVCIVYCNSETEEIKEIRKRRTIAWLTEFFDDLIERYDIFLSSSFDWSGLRNKSLIELEFPFDSYRNGQEDLIDNVYKAIKDKVKLFAQAPTGIGKTMSTIYPAVKSLGEGSVEKIFYLTAKTTTRGLANDAVNILRDKSAMLISTTLYAKEKICPNEKMQCDPVYCKYANGHYDRINNALVAALGKCKNFDKDAIETYSEEFCVCPFEFSLDLSVWSDIVICDYNYVFDPRVYLRRFFGDYGGEYVFLVDEVHNLVDRSREMYSSTLNQKPIFKFSKLTEGQFPKLSQSLTAINNYLMELSKHAKTQVLSTNYYISKELDSRLIKLLERFMLCARDYLDIHRKDDEYDEFLQVYFEVSFFIKIASIYDENYCTYLSYNKNETYLKLFCINPSKMLKNSFSKGKSAVLFSATLQPIDYYFSVLGGTDKDFSVSIDSPFIPDNKCIIVANDVATTYKKRAENYELIADYIMKTVSAKMGNYIVYFPSYKFMQDVCTIFKMKYHNIEIHVQERGYTDDERENFLKNFESNTSKIRIGFCVLGGVFSESIDLKHDRLIGSIVVGVGLPAVCLERELIRGFYSSNADYDVDYGRNVGYEYSYIYPGFTKVLQAAGRVIRTESDRGIILLLDERFASYEYSQLYPEDFYPIQYVNYDEIDDVLNEFWN